MGGFHKWLKKANDLPEPNQSTHFQQYLKSTTAGCWAQSLQLHNKLQKASVILWNTTTILPPKDDCFESQRRGYYVLTNKKSHFVDLPILTHGYIYADGPYGHIAQWRYVDGTCDHQNNIGPKWLQSLSTVWWMEINMDSPTFKSPHTISCLVIFLLTVRFRLHSTYKNYWLMLVVKTG